MPPDQAVPFPLERAMDYYTDGHIHRVDSGFTTTAAASFRGVSRHRPRQPATDGRSMRMNVFRVREPVSLAALVAALALGSSPAQAKPTADDVRPASERPGAAPGRSWSAAEVGPIVGPPAPSLTGPPSVDGSAPPAAAPTDEAAPPSAAASAPQESFLSLIHI